MATTAYSGSAPARATPAPSSKLLADLTRLLTAVRRLRTRLPATAPINHAFSEWLISGEVLAVLLAAGSAID